MAKPKMEATSGGREEPEPLRPFFQALAERLTNENDASDIFYAAFKAFEKFRSVVIGCLGLHSPAPLEIKREVVIGESRPDILFNAANEGARFLVEVKLFDRNYHYAEYSGLEIDGKKPEITLLAAHRPDPELKGWRQAQWATLVDELERSGDGINLALAEYFRRVAMCEQLGPISLGRPRGILYLNRALKQVIESYQSNEVVARVNRAAREGFTEVSSGWGYELMRRAAGGRSAWPYFCLAYTDNREGIEVSLKQSSHQDGWGELVAMLRGHYGPRLNSEGEWYYVRMPDEEFERLMSCVSLEEQLSILTRFLEEFNRAIEDWVNRSRA